MKITDIQNEIWAAACTYEGIEWESWGLDRAGEAYEYETRKRGYTDSGIEKAISDYLLHAGEFAEDGKFAEVADEGWVLERK